MAVVRLSVVSHPYLQAESGGGRQGETGTRGDSRGREGGSKWGQRVGVSECERVSRVSAGRYCPQARKMGQRHHRNQQRKPFQPRRSHHLLPHHRRALSTPLLQVPILPLVFISSSSSSSSSPHCTAVRSRCPSSSRQKPSIALAVERRRIDKPKGQTTFNPYRDIHVINAYHPL